MRVTARDLSIVTDITLGGVLSRDQVLQLYFGSISRANARLRILCNIGLIKRVVTPFTVQALYVATPKAKELLVPALAKVASVRSESPRFLRHSLATTEIRLALLKLSQGAWLYESQLWRKFDGYQIRPDGAFVGRSLVFIECDMGNVAPQKFAEKLKGYTALAQSGRCQHLYCQPLFNLLVVCPGSLRARRLSRQVPVDPGFGIVFETFQSMDIQTFPSWS